MNSTTPSSHVLTPASRDAWSGLPASAGARRERSQASRRHHSVSTEMRPSARKSESRGSESCRLRTLPQERTPGSPPRRWAQSTADHDPSLGVPLLPRTRSRTERLANPPHLRQSSIHRCGHQWGRASGSKLRIGHPALGDGAGACPGDPGSSSLAARPRPSRFTRTQRPLRLRSAPLHTSRRRRAVAPRGTPARGRTRRNGRSARRRRGTDGDIPRDAAIEDHIATHVSAAEHQTSAAARSGSRCRGEPGKRCRGHSLSLVVLRRKP
jgi:hypothetical protein